METIKKILISKEGRKFYVTDIDKDMHTQFGFIKSKDIKKAKPGSEVKSNTNEKFTVLEPSFIDSYNKIKRSAQIIIKKDVGYILAQTGIGKSSRVLDSGAGSGGFSLFAANVAKEVVTYDINKESCKLVEDNAEFLGIKNIKVRNKDIYEGISKEDIGKSGFDLIVLDLTEPWKAVKAANKALKIGGFLVNYSPCITSTMIFVDEIMKSKEFIVSNTVDLTETFWHVEGRKVRPSSQGIGHTGFLTFVRKIK